MRSLSSHLDIQYSIFNGIYIFLGTISEDL